jgi:choline dehydrogenase-like flavoprotein
LLLEFGDHSDDVKATQQVMGVMELAASKYQWDLKAEPDAGIGGRQTTLSHGRVLGGSSNVNGTLVIRGPRADYDDWGVEGWSGDEVYSYMNKVS